ITDSATAELQTPGESSSSAKGNNIDIKTHFIPNLIIPIPNTHYIYKYLTVGNARYPQPGYTRSSSANPANSITISSLYSQRSDNSNITKSHSVISINVTNNSMGHLHEIEETKSDHAKTLKRALFSTEPEEQKKNKSEQ
ncbi:hypothetical protein Tco_1089822, partial [Tanacetum coccineum]